MSEQTAQEPTMEEILASIRRIISEDDAPAGAAPAEEEAGEEPVAAAEPEPEFESAPEPEPVAALVPEPEPEPFEAQEDEVLELTQRVEPVGDLDFASPADAAPEPEPPPQPQAAPEPRPAMESLVSAATASAATSAFGQLAEAVAMPKEWLTLDAVVRELLQPLLKDWLDANLHNIVQTAVAEEVERIARARR